MRKALRYWLKQISCWILLLQMVNLSIDPPEASVVFQSKTQSQAGDAIAETETVYELVSEELLDIEVPETEETDVEKTVHLLELYYSHPPSFTLDDPSLPVHHLSLYNTRLLSWETIPNAPPPKLVLFSC